MKAVRKLTVMLILSLACSGAAFAAKSASQTYIESCRKSPELPEPVVVISPRLGPEYAGASVEVTFVVDTRGRPTAVAVQSAPDDTLAAAVVGAVKEWRFKPVMRNGAPVATKVVLPVKITVSPDEARYAAW